MYSPKHKKYFNDIATKINSENWSSTRKAEAINNTQFYYGT